jgi:hypothetical protein
MEEATRAHRAFVAKRELTFIGPRHDWQHNSKWIFKEQSGRAWTLIHPARGRDQWPALVNMVMNLQVP